jgi:PAS domain S-box-containing protein
LRVARQLTGLPMGFIADAVSATGDPDADLQHRQASADDGSNVMVDQRAGAQDRDPVRSQDKHRQLEARIKTQAAELSSLRARFTRYETALRGSHVSVYTQDRDLRYTSISNPMPGWMAEDIIGRTDEDLLPTNGRAAVVDLKREVLATGQAKTAEVAIDQGNGLRWHDLHVVPLHDDAGAIVGLTCASVDVTERKEGEAHLRLLLRELTHRSKNLLAVIQAMARQTARHAGSIDSFLRQFGARLQALAASHDLLVRESWHGASLSELIRSQLSAYFSGDGGQVSIEGPDVALKPEAAQNLGLALHELVANAEKFGALSVPEGRVSIVWSRHDGAGGDALDLNWREQCGPKVKTRRKHGFGSLVVERNLARALDAQVSLDFDADGLRCHVVIPASQILASR